MKIYAHVETVPLDADPALTERVALPGLQGEARADFAAAA